MPVGVTVGDAMRKSVITVKPGATAEKALKYMVNLDIGCVVVSEKHSPVGMVTSGNLLEQVFAKGRDPAQVKVNEIMSHPLRTVTPETDLEEALRVMRDLSLKRLPVVVEGRLIGILSERDIIYVSPALFELVAEGTELRMSGLANVAGRYEGLCESCGEYGETLSVQKGELVCRDCFDKG